MEIKYDAVLTTKEIAIIRLICEELTSQQIADILGIKKSAVTTSRKRIKDKIKAKNAAGVVAFALKNRIYIIPKTNEYSSFILAY